MEPTARQRRILVNLGDQNLIWEVVGRKYFLQFDTRLGREIRIQPQELEEMTASGWIRRVQAAKSEQRLNRYELAADAAVLTGIRQRKPPHSESEMAGRTRARQRGSAANLFRQHP